MEAWLACSSFPRERLITPSLTGATTCRHAAAASLFSLEPWRRTLYILFIAQFVSAVGFSNIVPFLPLYVQYLGSRSGLSVEFLAGMTFSAQAITGMVVAPFWGALADRYGRKLMVQRAVLGGGLLLLLMGFVRSAEELVLLRALQGLVTGILPASSALVAASAPRDNTGYAMGLLACPLGRHCLRAPAGRRDG